MQMVALLVYYEGQPQNLYRELKKNHVTSVQVAGLQAKHQIDLTEHEELVLITKSASTLILL